MSLQRVRQKWHTGWPCNVGDEKGELIDGPVQRGGRSGRGKDGGEALCAHQHVQQIWANKRCGVHLTTPPQYVSPVATRVDALTLEPDSASGPSSLSALFKTTILLCLPLARLVDALTLKLNSASGPSSLSASFKATISFCFPLARHVDALTLKPDSASGPSSLSASFKTTTSLCLPLARHVDALTLKPDSASGPSSLSASFKATISLCLPLARHVDALTLKPDSASGPSSSPVLLCLSKSKRVYSSCSHRNTCAVEHIGMPVLLYSLSKSKRVNSCCLHKTVWKGTQAC
eukprot:1148435-Pelagomonas_calceolata.AAC.3